MKFEKSLLLTIALFNTVSTPVIASGSPKERKTYSHHTGKKNSGPKTSTPVKKKKGEQDEHWKHVYSGGLPGDDE
jgi:hypothetical protein